jgi:hypothetical protein
MKNEIYKRFKLNPKNVKPGDLMKAAAKRKSEGKGFPVLHKKHKKGLPASAGQFDTTNGSSLAGRTSGALGNFGRTSMGSNANSTAPLAKKNMKHKTHKKSVERESPVGSLNAKQMNDGGKNAKKLGNEAAEFSKSKKMKTHCKSCGKSHSKHKEHSALAIKGMKEFVSEEAKEKGKKMKKHKKGLKLVAPSKGHKPNGAHGRAAVKELGRTKTTGNFARIEASKGKGAAINAFQAARRAHMGK